MKFYLYLPLFCLLAFLAVPVCAAEEEAKKEGDGDSSLVGTESMPTVIGNRAAVKVQMSPFEKQPQKAGSFVGAPKREKNLWADSWLFVDVPRLDEDGKILTDAENAEAGEAAEKRMPAAARIGEFIKVEQWYNEAPPSLEGKYVLVEFSASWCPVCRREIPDLNHWAEKYADDLVVISIYETDRQSIDTLPGDYQGKDMKYHVGIDTKRRTAGALGVYGIPHAVLIEPQYGAVIWEGMPNQPYYELTDAILDRVMEVGRKLKQDGKL